MGNGKIAYGDKYLQFASTYNVNSCRTADPFQIVIALTSDMFECHIDPVIRRHTHSQGAGGGGSNVGSVCDCVFPLPLTNINTKVALFVFNYVYLCVSTQAHTL